MPTAAMLSFRFGATDGVSVVARSWKRILERVGFDVVTIAGVEPAHRVVDGLGIDAVLAPDSARLRSALVDVDLTVVENLCTIPLNIPATNAVGAALAGRPAIMHHHDPPWHRDRWTHVTDMPLDDPAWVHVAITTTAARELAARRGISATVIPNGFDEPGPSDRAAQRARLDVGEAEILLAHPVRAIARKNVPMAVALAEEMGATYWLLGPAEEGYGDELERVLGSARCRVVRAPCASIDDIYAAADAIAYPSTWEGFGNPPIEASLRRRPSAVGHYAFAEELRSMGFAFFEPGDAAGLRDATLAPDTELLDRNETLARTHFSMESVRDALTALLDRAGWLP